MLSPVSLNLSGERFQIAYHIIGNEAEARATAEAICVEQTVEFPAELIPDDDIRSQILGRLESFQPADGRCYKAVISYALETAGGELPQLLNVIFGNTSLKPGIRVEAIDLPPGLLKQFGGPRFGRTGWRARLDVPHRPLLCTALKPMGLPPSALAEMAYQFALGGIDLIKDDHGLADQPFCRYRERVERCAAAVERANRETGMSCAYVPNVTAPADRVIERALFARQVGAGALLIAPGLAGFDALRCLAADDRVALPLMYHPAWQGAFVINPDSGVSHYVLFGQLVRLAGADATIYPNYGGRFSFSREECLQIVRGSAEPVGYLKPIFPAPGGGMSLQRVPELLDTYGNEVIFIIGGGLHMHGPDLVENCRHFRSLLEGR